MRVALALLVACGAPKPPPVLSAHAAAPDAPPCPDGLAERFGKANLDACVWGHFAGEGWLVYASTPFGPQAEIDPDQTRALIRRDGTIVFQIEAPAGANGMQAVSAIDLDGDGTDEIVMDLHWSSNMAPLSGESLVISQVRGNAIEDVYHAAVSYSEGFDPVQGCDGKLAIAGRQITIDVTPIVAKNPGPMMNPDTCLPPGRHVVEMRAGKIIVR